MQKYLTIIFLSGALIFFSLGVKNKNNRELCGNNCNESFALQIDHDSQGIFNDQPISVPTIAAGEPISDVLGAEESAKEKHIYVDLSTQTLTAFEGDELYMKTPISSGLWGRTPTGDFTIWTKIRSTRMTGGSGADYYNLPNVPFVMFFSNREVAASRGFSFHGAYWHNNFGHAMSHGCINLKTTDAAKLYNWVDQLGTKVTIYES